MSVSFLLHTHAHLYLSLHFAIKINTIVAFRSRKIGGIKKENIKDNLKNFSWCFFEVVAFSPAEILTDKFRAAL